MSQNPASTRLVPAERLSAITSLIAEGAVFDGNFHTNRDQGIKVDLRTAQELSPYFREEVLQQAQVAYAA